MAHAPHEVALAARNLTVGYGDAEVLSGVDLQVAYGEVRVILGGSGCGKSTLLRHLVGLLAPKRGEVRLLGEPLHAAQGARRERLLQRIGVLFQSGALLGGLSVLENVALPLRQQADYPQEVALEVARLKLALVGLAGAAEAMPAVLSGGMRKRVALARAMALDPEVLFCDEPSAGLDPTSAADLDRLLLDLRQQFGTTLVVVTHELASIHGIADRVLMLEGGRVVADGALQEVSGLQVPSLRRFFHREASVKMRVEQSLERALVGPKGA